MLCLNGDGIRRGAFLDLGHFVLGVGEREIEKRVHDEECKAYQRKPPENGGEN